MTGWTIGRMGNPDGGAVRSSTRGTQNQRFDFAEFKRAVRTAVRLRALSNDAVRRGRCRRYRIAGFGDSALQRFQQASAIAEGMVAELRPSVICADEYSPRPRRPARFQVVAMVADHHQVPGRHAPARGMRQQAGRMRAWGTACVTADDGLRRGTDPQPRFRPTSSRARAWSLRVRMLGHVQRRACRLRSSSTAPGRQPRRRPARARARPAQARLAAASAAGRPPR